MPAEAPATACCHSGSGVNALPDASGFDVSSGTIDEFG